MKFFPNSDPIFSIYSKFISQWLINKITPLTVWQPQGKGTECQSLGPGDQCCLSISQVRWVCSPGGLFCHLGVLSPLSSKYTPTIKPPMIHLPAASVTASYRGLGFTTIFLDYLKVFPRIHRTRHGIPHWHSSELIPICVCIDAMLSLRLVFIYL